jgi:hypothetical protein
MARSRASHRLTPRLLLAALLVVLASAAEATAQPTPPDRPRNVMQAGLALVPGFGAQVGYVQSRTIFTVEGLLYVDASPQFAGGEGTVELSSGLGAAIRPLGFPRLIGTADYPYDFDIGLRFGPSLTFTQGATRAEKNQQFSLFVEPFLRFSSRLSSGRLYFVEAGTQRPLFRAGVFFTF